VLEYQRRRLAGILDVSGTSKNAKFGVGVFICAVAFLTSLVLIDLPCYRCCKSDKQSTNISALALLLEEIPGWRPPNQKEMGKCGPGNVSAK
jgi:hypothetical protein